MLEKLQATPVFVSNGKRAYDTLKKQSFDLLLSDIGMPEMDGYELIRKWRTYEHENGLKPLPAVALTAYATAKDRTLALEAGYQSHIAKPVDRAELLAVIRSLGVRSKDIK